MASALKSAVMARVAPILPGLFAILGLATTAGCADKGDWVAVSASRVGTAHAAARTPAPKESATSHETTLASDSRVAATAFGTDVLQTRVEAKVRADEELRWIHPLAGERYMPIRESREFGAWREGARPFECGRGHCGVDVGEVEGSVIHAAADGVVARLSHSPWGRAGRFIVLAHPGGIETSYLHLDEMRADIDVGLEVRAGDPIATLGTSGIANSGAHLHFGVAMTMGEGRRYIDPEPILEYAAVLPGEGAFDLPSFLGQSSPLIGATLPMTLGATSLPAVVPEPTPIAPPVDTSGTLRVALVDSHSNGPVRGVTVVARGPGNQTVSAHSGYKGIALFDGLSTGTWQLMVSSPDYVVSLRSVAVDGSERVTLELTKGAILAGEVRDENGDRVSGARVWLDEASTLSDDAGRFRLINVATGDVTLFAEQGEREGALDMTLAPGDELVTLQVDVE